MNGDKDVSLRIGIAKGEFAVPENIDGGNEVIGGLFEGNVDEDFLTRAFVRPLHPSLHY